ncbi:YihY/virulence factor BrkB family protein [Jiangella rhizosphaerae]|uniref:YihY/virulence factor BrkB family protein n=1 Tax=Jiangella rhizosphaerae TaxID=2293569 RepID=A0A418KT58_9ACTN|nr:YihY/virulence factor BrkB family protein [Jiangella rhizosphaerae]RIQ29587.1 YihY/virulence factor BrkB family protein [Jiangella rhizosphaerae]
MATETRGRGAPAGPAPDDERKPDSPTQLTKPSWGYVARRTVREFLDDECPDQAAALTYYAMLSLFPALVALAALPALIGQDSQRTTDQLMQIVQDIAPSLVTSDVQGPIEQLTKAPGAGWALVIGLLAALWSASGYVDAFGRAMNRVYDVQEGRPFWKLRPAMLAITLLTMLLVLAVAVMLVVSGPVARAIGDAVGLGDTAVTVWNIAKWPVLVLVVVVIVAILYWGTPNVRQPKFRWISMGAVIAIVVWALGSAAFGIYVANFGSYNKTYGSLAGVVVFLLWLWLTNLALLFGAEFDAETERARELQAGLPAEESIQLPPRDTRKIEKSAEKQAMLVRRGRRLRRSRGDDTDLPEERG